MENVKVGLVKGRHKMPVEKYIFDEIPDVTDFEKFDLVAEDFLSRSIGIDVAPGRGLNSASYTDDQIYRGRRHLTVYVSGLSAALAAVIGACGRLGVTLTLLHYNRSTDTYIPQEIF